MEDIDKNKDGVVELTEYIGTFIETDYSWSAAASPMSSWHAAHG